MCIKICICVANPYTNIKKIPALQDKYIYFYSKQTMNFFKRKPCTQSHLILIADYIEKDQQKVKHTTLLWMNERNSCGSSLWFLIIISGK